MANISIKPALLRDASYVMAHLRPRDYEEAYCQIDPKTKRHELAYWLVTNAWRAYVAYVNGKPAAVFGTTPISICQQSVWALGTKQMPRAIPAITKLFVSEIVPAGIAAGFQGMEARTIVTHTQAHRWMEATGAKLITPEPYPYGRDGELFYTYHWTLRDYRGIRETKKLARELPDIDRSGAA